jgi:hypothetical protein
MLGKSQHLQMSFQVSCGMKKIIGLALLKYSSKVCSVDAFVYEKSQEAFETSNYAYGIRENQDFVILIYSTASQSYVN